MKRIAFISVILSTLCFGCGKENRNNEDPLQSLKGTRWKLAGIVDAETGSLKELDPGPILGPIDHRTKCYTLAFDTDSTFSTFSSTNEIWGSYNINYKTGEIFIHCDLMTEVAAMGDESLYIETLNRAQSFLLKNKELKLYLNVNKNSYMLFEAF